MDRGWIRDRLDRINGAELREQAAASVSRAIELALTLGYTGDKG
jgi:hypothetical protein